MNVFKRNQMIVTALVIMIAIAAYLNYVDRKPAEGEWVFQTQAPFAAENLVPNLEEDFFSEGTAATDLDLFETEIAENEDDLEFDLALEIGEDDEAIAENLDPNAEQIEVSTNKDNTAEPGAAIFVNSNTVNTPYFITAKIEREQSRAKQRDLLAECINNKNFPKEEKAQASQDLLTLRKRIEQESASEAMIEAKGFKEVFVRIGEQTVDVVIDSPGLSEAEAAQILDIVNRQTGITLDKIYINPLKVKN